LTQCNPIILQCVDAGVIFAVVLLNAAVGGSRKSRHMYGLAADFICPAFGTPVEIAHMLVANLDYRFPLARVERGIRSWPFFLRDLHGAVFADVGSAGHEMDELPAAAWSVGGELAARLTLAYTWNLSLAAGAAWVRDPARPDQRDRFAAFVRTGYAF